jgi:hypothetical protein
LRSRLLAHAFAIVAHLGLVPAPATAQEAPAQKEPAPAPAVQPGPSRPVVAPPAAPVDPGNQRPEPAPDSTATKQTPVEAPSPSRPPTEARDGTGEKSRGEAADSKKEEKRTPQIGRGYNAFDRNYLLFGPSIQYPNHSKALFQRTTAEFELSFVPKCLIARSLLWAGGWVMGGAHFTSEKTGTRGGIGAEVGYRFVAMDLGYVHDGSRWSRNGVRFRLGPAFSMELFTSADYRRGCCVSTSDIACECDRRAWGLSIFPYWALEHYPGTDTQKEAESDGMFGISVKVATGR